MTLKSFVGTISPHEKNKLEIALGMLELDYALENDKLVAPAAGVDNFDELMETYKKNIATWECSNRMCWGCGQKTTEILNRSSPSIVWTQQTFAPK
jgi:hypothetical protein